MGNERCCASCGGCRDALHHISTLIGSIFYIFSSQFASHLAPSSPAPIRGTAFCRFKLWRGAGATLNTIKIKINRTVIRLCGAFIANTQHLQVQIASQLNEANPKPFKITGRWHHCVCSECPSIELRVMEASYWLLTDEWINSFSLFASSLALARSDRSHRHE